MTFHQSLQQLNYGCFRNLSLTVSLVDRSILARMVTRRTASLILESLPFGHFSKRHQYLPGMFRINLNLNVGTSAFAMHRRECLSVASSTSPYPSLSLKLGRTGCHDLRSVVLISTAPRCSDRCRVSAHLDSFEKLYSFLMREVVNLKLSIFCSNCN